MQTIDDSAAIIPGMGPEDKIDFTESLTSDRGFIPGLDLDTSQINDRRSDRDKKVPYSKPIPRNFQAQWNDTGRAEDDELMSKDMKESIIADNVPMIPLQKVAPTAIIVYGITIPVTRKCSFFLAMIPHSYTVSHLLILFPAGSRLDKVISEGSTALNEYISSGEIEELNDLLPPMKDEEYDSDSSYDNKPSKCRKQPYDHNAQLVFEKDSTNPPAFIPPLMALNVLPEPIVDKDYKRNANGRDNDIWQSNQNNPWAGNNGSSFMANNNSNNNMPPSLLNITIQPPDMSPTDNSNGNSWDRRSGDNSRNRDDRSRRRDGDGRRGSRFDNGGGESRRRTSGNDSSSRSSDKSGRRSGRNRRRS